LAGEVKAALRLVWFVVTLVTFSTLIAAFGLPDAWLARITPLCESKRLYGRPCVLCGTTTGFRAIARGDPRAAMSANGLALPLFATFSANAIVAVSYILSRGRRR
jgi:hypothetical protein